MKIIITVASYYPHKDGVQAVTQYHAEGLAAKGHDVTVITSMIPDIKNEEIHNGVKIIRVNAFNKHLIHSGDKNKYRELVIKLSKDADALVAVCLQSYSADWLLGILDDINCKKILYMHGMHDFKWNKANINSLAEFSKKLIRNIWWGVFYNTQRKKIRKYNIVVQLHRNDTAYKYFEKHKLGKNIVIENAVDDEFFSKELEPIENLPSKYFISVANYDKRKNQKMCMEAFYKANTSDYGLIFIGSRENKYYDKLVKYKNKLDKKYEKKDVRLLTQIPRHDVCRYVKHSYGYLMSSIWEAFPISIIESMAANIPFISTDVGIVSELAGGIVVSNTKEMSEWIEKIIKNEKLAKQISDNGRLYAEANLTKNISIMRLEDAITNLVTKKQVLDL